MNGNLGRTTATLDKIHRLNLKKRLLLIRALGHTLGEAIHDCHYRGIISTEDILGLYRESADGSGEAKRLYIDWTSRTSPFRGEWDANDSKEVKAD
jgi:hypothetical protein